MNLGPAFDLHLLVRAMDGAADRILTRELGLGYRRFLALVVTDSAGPLTQRALAEQLGTTEASTSRMVRSLEGAGLVTVTPSGTGRARHVTLTDAGRDLRTRAAALLEGSFEQAVAGSGVDLTEYQRQTHLLRDALGGT